MAMTKEDSVTLAAMLLNLWEEGCTIQKALERAEALWDLAIRTSELQNTGIVVVAAAIQLSKPGPGITVFPSARPASDAEAISNARTLYQFVNHRSVEQFRRICAGSLAGSTGQAAHCGDPGRDPGDEHEEATLP